MKSLLNIVEPEKAEGVVATVYSQVKEAFGMIPNAVQLHSVSPKLLERLLEHFGYYSAHSIMSEKLQTIIRLLVSDDKGCDYCVSLNTSFLLGEGMTMDEVNRLKKDPTTASLESKEKTLLLYVLKATSAPKSTTKEDVANLRDLGYSDKDIFDAVYYGANMVMVDILFETFQLENDQM